MTNTNVESVEPKTINLLSQVTTATIATQLYKRGLKKCYLRGVKPLHTSTPSFVAPAYTLRNIPMRDDLGDMSILANPEYPQRYAVEKTPIGHCLVYCGSRAAPASVAELYAVEVQVPVGCGGVAIFPGDIIAGDKDGVIVIPRNLAEEIAEDAPEQERYERYVLSRVQAGDSITGLYPSTEESRKRYQAWEG